MSKSPAGMIRPVTSFSAIRPGITLYAEALPPSYPVLAGGAVADSLRPELEKLISETSMKATQAILDSALPFGTVSTSAVLGLLSVRLM